jgi:hypothetical protein
VHYCEGSGKRSYSRSGETLEQYERDLRLPATPQAWKDSRSNLFSAITQWFLFVPQIMKHIIIYKSVTTLYPLFRRRCILVIFNCYVEEFGHEGV